MKSIKISKTEHFLSIEVHKFEVFIWETKKKVRNFSPRNNSLSLMSEENKRKLQTYEDLYIEEETNATKKQKTLEDGEISVPESKAENNKSISERSSRKSSHDDERHKNKERESRKRSRSRERARSRERRDTEKYDKRERERNNRGDHKEREKYRSERRSRERDRERTPRHESSKDKPDSRSEVSTKKEKESNLQQAKQQPEKSKVS